MNRFTLPTIVAVSGDPGGAAAIAPVLTALHQSRRVSVQAFAYRQARELWTKRSLTFRELDEKTTLAETEELFRSLSPAALLTSTSGNGIDLEKHFIAAARACDIPSLTVLDFWSNYRIRFSNAAGNLAYLPDKIAVMDDRTQEEMLADGFDVPRIVVTGQPAFDELSDFRERFTSVQRQEVRRGLRVSDDELLICFASQPLSDVFKDSIGSSYLGYDEKIVLHLLLAALENITICHPRKLVLAIRPHPRENPASFSAYSANRFRIQVASEAEGRDLVLASDLVVGMNSMLLVEATYLGCQTLSLQPGLRTPDALPTSRSGQTRAVYLPEEIEPAISEMLLKMDTPAQANCLMENQQSATANVVNLLFGMTGLRANCHDN